MRAQYPKPWTPDHAAEAAAKLDELAELAAGLSITIPALSAAREKISRARRFVDEIGHRHEDPATLQRRIARELVSGKLDLDGAAAEIVRAAPNSTLREAVRRTEGIATRQAFAETAAELDGDAVLERCREIVAETLAEIRKLRKPLDAITTAQAATEAGAKAAGAWVAYRDALKRFKRAHKLAKCLRDLAWIEPLPIGLSPAFGRMDLVREDTRAAKRAGVPLLELLDERCDAWLPGGPYFESEALAFEREQTAAASDQHRRQREREARLTARLEPKAAA